MVVFIKIGQIKRAVNVRKGHLTLYCFLMCWNAFIGVEVNPKTRLQSASVMSALTIIQDVRHGPAVHIYRFLLPGKYRMKIKDYINISNAMPADLNAA